MESTTTDASAWMLGSQEGDAYWSLGSLTVLKATDENTQRAFSVIEERMPAGASAPRHVHRDDDELFYVLDGTVVFEINGEKQTATTGSTVFVPHGVAHTYLATEETHWLMLVTEPGLEQLWASVGRPAETWTIPDDSVIDDQMARVFDQLDQYGIDVVGNPLTLNDI